MTRLLNKLVYLLAQTTSVCAVITGKHVYLVEQSRQLFSRLRFSMHSCLNETGISTPWFLRIFVSCSQAIRNCVVVAKSLIYTELHVMGDRGVC